MKQLKKMRKWLAGGKEVTEPLLSSEGITDKELLAWMEQEPQLPANSHVEVMRKGIIKELIKYIGEKL